MWLITATVPHMRRHRLNLEACSLHWPKQIPLWLTGLMNHTELCDCCSCFCHLSVNPPRWHACMCPSFILWLRLYFWSVLLWPQRSCSSSSSWPSSPQVRQQDGDQRQLGVGHCGDQGGRGRPADGQLREDGDRHHAGERHPPGFDAVTGVCPCSPSAPLLHPTSHILSSTCHMCSISSVSGRSQNV